jgi:hypothetical protein
VRNLPTCFCYAVLARFESKVEYYTTTNNTHHSNTLDEYTRADLEEGNGALDSEN